ncbi:hypothetical protein NE897_00255 [Yersinia ruckeri]|uniref:Uncharacterized protein n=1 Tax=Yersinia ruckeri TaxID=29486 RepID=A0A085U7C8_YERRU|nr:hypothetical protein [Yersinia ruckeri]AJI96263.1 hypothetical protein BD65_264 [Yersinia ruckeri]AKA37175.1 hypothetical protein UGYR_01405 [Yersinia ruckeri]ARZ01102.1 hypothetical protein QMA0440_01765 [Yersinia ruckeri]AUQ43176.1 hypothetical protein NJ56_15410 [Yersinia ruckeri]EEP99174.1 hypothetical protein yruck0001_14970 [Yersinia ruckeri ATCC 29473]
MKYMQMAIIAMMATAFEPQAAYLSVPTLATADIIISDPQSISHTLVPERGLVAGPLNEGAPVALGYVQTLPKETSIALAWALGKQDTTNINIIPSQENPNNTLTVSFFNPDGGQAAFVNHSVNAYVLSTSEAKTNWRYVVRATHLQTVAAGTYKLAVNAYFYAL